jgi:lipopolysaccharide transport system permease protein
MSDTQFTRRRRAAIQDFKRGLARWRFAALLAWEELFSPVRLTSLGIIWLIIQPLVWMIAMIVLIRPSVDLSAHLYPTYIASGVVLFTGLTTMIGGGAYVFSRERGRIKNVPLPLSLFVLKTVFLAGMEMLVALPIVIGAMVLTGVSVSETTLLAIPGLVLFFAFGSGATLALGTAAARYPSIVLMTRAAMRILLFITPVFWVPSVNVDLRFVVAHYNPLFHLIRVIRDPMLGLTPSLMSWAIASVTSMTALTVGLIIFVRFRERIAVWL